MKRTTVITMILTGLLGVSIATNLTITRANADQTSVTNQAKVRTLKTTIPPVYVSYWNTWRHVQLTKPIQIAIQQAYKNNMGGWDQKTTAIQTPQAGTDIYIRWYQNYHTQLEVQFSQTTSTAYTSSKENVNLIQVKALKTVLPVKLIQDATNVTSIKPMMYKPTNDSHFNQHWKVGIYDGDDPVYLFRSYQQYQKYAKLEGKAGDMGDAFDDPTPKEQKMLNQVHRQLKAARQKAVVFKNPRQTVLVKQNNSIGYKVVKLNQKVYYTDPNNGINLNNTTINGTNTIQSLFAPTKKNAQFIKSQYQLYDYTGEKWQVGKQIWQYNGHHWQKIK